MARWKRGVGGQGVRQAVSYALGGTCDAHHERVATVGEAAAAGYATERTHRFVVEDGTITVDALDKKQLQDWVAGIDPETGVPRGRENPSPDADLLLDATINAPKSYSIAAQLDPELAAAYEGLQDRIRDRTIVTWQSELNARRGHAGAVRESLSRVEVVELRHERSRSLDPHKHRHLWLSMKVRGEDGRWTNVDSRVAMRLQNVINAEGELAARTDPEWLAALASKGLTLDGHGEVEQLAHLVRPLSRRSNQIEANRAVKIVEWHDGHPGQHPTAKDLAAIDRWAYSHDRPNKPGQLVEDDWQATVRSELAALDPELVAAFDLREPVTATTSPAATPDVGQLAWAAMADADRRSAASGGRFSRWDVRAGAVRAVAASGVRGDRSSFDQLIADTVTLALRSHCADMTAPTSEVAAALDVFVAATPGHVKSLMATTTVKAKQTLQATLDQLSVAGQAVSLADMAALAERTLDAGQSLDAGQLAAASIVAGTDRLVTVTGAAGAGKTTMLKVAVNALRDQNRNVFVIAPTKKAASVAGREIGSVATSVHALLLDHGFQFGEDDAGMPTWHRLRRGDPIPGSTAQYTGPKKYLIGKGDRIIVDEAAMIDLHAAAAVAVVAYERGAGIAMVGDHRQVRPVGHSGAMAMARAAATVNSELTAVHRFRNPDGTINTDYAELTLKLREPGDLEDAVDVAGLLIDGGHVLAAANDDAARQLIIDRYFELIGERTPAGRAKTVAIATSTNLEAQQINEAIQARRIQLGELPTATAAFGQNEQPLYVGDIIQTRRNDRSQGVENRQLWRIRSITKNGAVVVECADRAGELKQLAPDYVEQHTHLAYASTVHGIQGETTDAAIVGPGVSAEGLYVGMTRGRFSNEVVLTTRRRDAQIAELADIMITGTTETTIDDNRAAALDELSRAARAARWDDLEHRPAGTFSDLDTRLRRAVHARDELQVRLARAADPIKQHEASRLAYTLKLANAESGARRGEIDQSDLEMARALSSTTTTMADKLGAAVNATTAALDTCNRSVVMLEREANIRASLTLADRLAEDRARRGSPIVQSTRTPPSAVPSVTIN